MLFPKAIATGSPLPRLKEIGHTVPTFTGAVNVVLLKVTAWATAELANAPRTRSVYILYVKKDSECRLVNER